MMKRRRYRRQPVQKKSEGSDQFLKPTVQTKLSMGQPGDKYEVEADKMADQVVSNKSTEGALQKKEGEEEVQQKPLASQVTPLVQKKGASEEENVQGRLQRMEEEEAVQSKEEEEVQSKEEEEVQAKGEEEEVQAKEEEEVQAKGEEEEVQAKEEEEVQAKDEEEEVQAKEEEEIQAKCAECDSEGVQAKEEEEVQAKSNGNQAKATSVESRLRNGSGGQPMDSKTKSDMESGFGADFSNVNIHTDSEAAQMSSDIGAQAFTHGNDIYFNEGKYNPSTHQGKHLLAHELTHTIQQKGMVQKKTGGHTSGKKIQRKVTDPPKDLACTPANSSPGTSGETLNFPVSGSNFTKEQQEGINNFVRNWHLAPEVVRIDGYASVDGPEVNNWHLSCKRAITAKNALMNPTDGSPGIPEAHILLFAHGETSQFGSLTQNRRVTINLPTRLPVPPVTNEPTVDHKTIYNAPDGSADTRLNVGVGEEVLLTSNVAGNWSATKGTPKTIVGANKFKWTAPNRAATVSVTFESGGATITKIFTVVEPNRITGTNQNNLAIAPGTQGAGMELDFRYHPLNVSFGNVEAKEVSHRASNINGYFIGRGNLYHNTGDLFTQIGPNNIDTATDTAAIWGYPAPWAAGGFDWDIPNHFRVNTENGDGKRFTTVDQDFRIIDATGRTTVDKAGLQVDRTP